MPTLSGGGAERIISYLANNINRENYIPEILLIYQTNHIFIKNIAADIKINYLNLDINKKYFFLQTLKGILRIKPDIVLLGLSGINVLVSPFIPLFNRKIRWVARETNIASLHVTNNRMLFLYRYFYKNYDTIITQSNDMKNDLVSNFKIDHRKMIIINNPIDTNFIDSQLNIESPVSYSPDKINLLACGRLNQQKGFDLLIKAFSTLTNKDKYHLTIIGKSESEEYTEYLHSLIEENNLEDYISFKGFQSNSFKWFQKADIFILSSRYEGFPNVLLESLYCGTPVLANNCKGGINEIVINNENGFVYDYKKNDFEQNLELISSKKFSSKHLSQIAKERFGLNKIIRQYESVFK